MEVWGLEEKNLLGLSTWQYVGDKSKGSCISYSKTWCAHMYLMGSPHTKRKDGLVVESMDRDSHQR